MLRSIIERAVQKVMITASLRDGIASFVRDKELSSFENWLRGPDQAAPSRVRNIIVKHDKGYFIHLRKWSDTRGSNS